MKSFVFGVALLAGSCAQGLAWADARPSEAQIVQAQGQYARSELMAIAAALGQAPDSAAKEAFQSGEAVIRWRRWSPATGTVARGPTLREAIYPLLANVAAAKAQCDSLEGPCQAKAAALAKKQTAQALGDPNPARALGRLLGSE